MADAPKSDGAPSGTPPKPASKPNPAFRMMGMPNFKFKLPSRNWLIFLGVTGSWTAAVLYDKHQKKKVQKKWCDLVAHLAEDPLPTNYLRRKLTIFLAAPPGDGVRPSRQYFKEYVKPILVAAALDYDVIEGRKEGDVRYGTAEQIRRLRRKLGEKSSRTAEEDALDKEKVVDEVREKLHVVPEPGIRGDLVLGRHTWKEYIRGVHEGWLGPIDEPLPPAEPEPEPSPIHPPTEARTNNPAATTEDPEVTKKSDDQEKKTEEEKKEEKKKPYPPPAYLSTEQYPSSTLSPYTPNVLEPSQPIHQQHLLGFLKFPQRIYNFLNRRHLADQVGRDTAAIVLAAHRPYHRGPAVSTTDSDLEADPLATRAPENDAAASSRQSWEQQTVLADEERTWHKSVRKPAKEGDTTERVWLNDIVIDNRIGERMRRFELDPEEEARANRIANGVEKPQSRYVGDEE
ncbi:Mitochondrial import inner membrane translocase subunit tim54 [Exophiala dermatitidis]